ncbi:MAG: heparan-alpha-glucosaminide N-acetyltransferase [Pseudomonadota bacterium]|nr:heparan-alpha-glucosaminide N-acetyltransferase [Pseudomonadota bacterium]
MLAQAHTSRLVLIDALRGCAIVLMVIYHLCFDLSYFGLASFDFYRDPFWLNLRTLILSLFLGLVGVSLVLASHSRLNVRRYLQRLILLVASAVLVSLSSWWMFGERFVFFGVLHFITIASVLGLLFVRAGWFNLIAGVGVILFATQYQAAWFDTAGRRWIGLMTHKPLTEDYVPLLPWFGVVLLGLFVGPYIMQWSKTRLQGTTDAASIRWLALAGRHSLVIYLIHQPLLIGALSVYVKLVSQPV